MDTQAIFSDERSFAEWTLTGLDGAPALLFPSLFSTNLWLKEHAGECSHGTVILANHQDGGRGRFDRIWRSPADKNLYLSILLQPHGLSMEQWPHLTQVAAITLGKLYHELGVDVHVKWPNDLLWNKHKMCGILSERTTRAGQPALVLGIGINVNSGAEDFEGLDRLAASLSIAIGHPLNREAFLREYLRRLEESFAQFIEFGIGPWLAEWRAMKNFIGSRARVVLLTETIHGIVQGIRDDGSLLFLPDGKDEPMIVYSGDLEI